MDLKVIARRLGLKDLISEPFRSQFTDSMEFTAKTYQVKLNKKCTMAKHCVTSGNESFNDLNDHELKLPSREPHSLLKFGVPQKVPNCMVPCHHCITGTILS